MFERCARRPDLSDGGPGVDGIAHRPVSTKASSTPGRLFGTPPGTLPDTGPVLVEKILREPGLVPPE